MLQVVSPDTISIQAGLSDVLGSHPLVLSINVEMDGCLCVDLSYCLDNLTGWLGVKHYPPSLLHYCPGTGSSALDMFGTVCNNGCTSELWLIYRHVINTLLVERLIK